MRTAMRRRLSAIVLVAVTVVGTPAARARADEPAPVEITTRDATAEAGLEGVAGDRFSLADYDGDGDPDLLVEGQRLYRNDTVRAAGKKPVVRFADVTVASGMDKAKGGSSGIFVDVDGDGRLDVVTLGGSVMLQGKGGAFTDVAAAWGLVLPQPATAVGAGDVDGDGFPELLFGGGEAQPKPGQFAFAVRRLFKNVGGKRFEDDTARHDLKEPRYGRSVVFADYDRDGDLDVYLGNYRLQQNELLDNEGGVLRDRAKEAGVAKRHDPAAVLDPTTNQRFGPTWGHTIAASWADLDGDGDLDLWVSNLAHKFVGAFEQNGQQVFDMRGYLCDDSAIFRSDGPPGWGFTDVRADSGIATKPVGGADAYQGEELWSDAACGDLDGDGLPEVYVAQVYEEDDSYSLLFKNDGAMRFTEASEKAGTRRFDSYGGAFADVDGDGDLDLVVGGKAEPKGKQLLRLLVNETPAGPWVAFRLRGRKPNPTALGAQVTVETDRGPLVRQVECAMGSHSQANEPTCRFGLRGRVAKSAWVRWPGSVIQEVKGRLSGLVDVAFPDGVAIPSPTIPLPKDVVAGAPVAFAAPPAPAGWSWSFDVRSTGEFSPSPDGRATGVYEAPRAECRARLSSATRGLAREFVLRFPVAEKK